MADAHASNISSKVFVRSTRNGKVQKIVRELYLRQDIPCSSKLCSTCLSSAPANADGVGTFALLENHRTQKLTTFSQYLLSFYLIAPLAHEFSRMDTI